VTYASDEAKKHDEIKKLISSVHSRPQTAGASLGGTAEIPSNRPQTAGASPSGPTPTNWSQVM